MSDITLAVRRKLCRLSGHRKKDENPDYASVGIWHPFLSPLTLSPIHWENFQVIGSATVSLMSELHARLTDGQ